MPTMMNNTAEQIDERPVGVLIAPKGAASSAQRSEGAESNRMWIYYQKRSKEEHWHIAHADERAEIISKYRPRYVTALATTLHAEEGEKISRDAKNEARYAGDFYIDWDATSDDLNEAILKVNEFLTRLERDGADLQAIRLFCSGGRGFHCEVPVGLFCSTVPKNGVQHLPIIYREIAFELFVETMDMNIYSSGRGRQWRQPNVQRENGNYKVPITVEEMRSMTTALYADLVSKTRDIAPRSEPRFCPALGVIFSKAKAKVTAELTHRRGGRKNSHTRTGSSDDGASDAVRKIREVADAALEQIATLLPLWLPDGAWEGSNYVALNPRREDTNPGSFKIHGDGYWIDYACEAHKGGDLVALKRFLDGDTYSMLEASRRVAAEIGLPGKSAAEATAKVIGSEVPTKSASTTSTHSQKQPVIGSVMDLLSETFAPIRWIVPEVLPEGLSLLAGSPKTGKSWMVLEIAMAVASGGTCLGGKRAMEGRALYLALEDNKRRLQDRIKQILQGGMTHLPEKMEFAIAWPRLDQGGLEHLDKWLSDHPDARLVVIDTLAKMRKKQSGNSNLYAEDYEVGEQLKQLSDKYRVAVVLVTHVRKAESQDPLEMVTGTLGLSGGMDGILVLKRQRGQGTASLYVTGRDVPEDKYYGLVWDKDTCRWAITGDASDLQISESRKEVLAVLAREKRPLAAKEINDLAGRKLDATRRLLTDMVRDQLLEQVRDGQRWLYVHPRISGERSPTSRATPPTPPTLTSSPSVGVLGKARDAALSGLCGTAATGGPPGSDVSSGSSGSSGRFGAMDDTVRKNFRLPYRPNDDETGILASVH